MAPGWERRRETTWDASAHIGRQLVDAVSPQPGETILELAAGAGDTGFLAAPLVRPHGKVISSDLSPKMIEVARRRAAELGLEGVEFRVLDAQSLDLPDACVDAVVCRWGYMLMPSPAAALKETRRVLRPNGRLAFSVWGAPARNPWAAIVGSALAAAGHMDAPSEGKPGIFTLADPQRIEALVVEAGFEPPTLTEVEMLWPFPSFADYWAFMLDYAGALAMVIDQLSSEQQEAVKRSVRDALGDTATGAFELGGLCLNASTRAL